MSLEQAGISSEEVKLHLQDMRIVAHKGKIVGVGTMAVKISEEHVGGREAPELAQIDEILIKVSP